MSRERQAGTGWSARTRDAVGQLANLRFSLFTGEPRPRMRFTSIHPILAVDDLGDALDEYTRRLGLGVVWTWGDPPARAGVGRDGLELQLVADGRFAPTHSSYVYVQMQGVDEYYAACVDRGARILTPLGDRGFGVRDFRVADLSGNILGFGEPR